LANNVALVNATSQLERFMVGGKKQGIFKESLTAQISAAIFYQATTVSKLETNKAFHSTFNKIIFDQIEKDFGAYIDAQARTKPKSLHHVYEWQKVGQENARLFKINKIPSQGLSVSVSYDFLDSKSAVPAKRAKRRYVFKDKASIMEEGIPVVVSPRYAERIVFDTDLGYTVFMPKGASVTIKRPGGVAAKKSFETAYRRFFTTDLVSESIKRSGFHQIFNTKVGKALSLPAQIKKVRYSFSPGGLRIESEVALDKAFGGSL
jgi:hypothetical protein